MKWFIKLTTDVGWIELPLDPKGYKTKKEAEEQAELAKGVPGFVSVEILKNK